MRPAALLALAIPVLGGLAFMAAQGAPTHYLAVNAGCMALGLALIAWAPRPEFDPKVAAAILAALLFLPFLTGPEINGVQRWIGIGPIGLNTALLAFPTLAVLAARIRDGEAVVLAIVVLAAAVAQPDASLGLALGGAAIGLGLAKRETRSALVAIAGLLAAIWAHKRGVLPPQSFVERVYLDAATNGPLWLLLLVAATIAGIVLTALDRATPRAERFALAGAITGFVYTAAMSDYPTPLIGYGAAPILGLALALWLARSRGNRSEDQISSG